MDNQILRLRRFNRFYTGLLGLLNRHILGGPLGLAQARVLYEIGADPGCRAAELAERLGMDKGALSRMLAGFADKGLVERATRDTDRRSSSLRLTGTGRILLSELEARSNEQAGSLLDALPEPSRRQVLAAMDTLEDALSPDAEACPRPVLRPPKPGDLGHIVESHGRIYQREYGFDLSFEGYVIHGLHEFLAADPKQRLLMVAEHRGRPVGSIALMPRPGEPGAKLGQLRWFLVEPECRGQGTGRELLRAAVDFARRRGYGRLYLWTLGMLDAARGLYRSEGFTLAETRPGSMGGRPMDEERWDLIL